MITTERLILRRWREQDVEPFVAMSLDPKVMDWLGGVLTPEKARARLDGFDAGFDERGYGRWAIQRSGDAALIGYAGMMPIGGGLLPLRGVEIGWALVRDAWGQGYASEAARAALADGFNRVGLAEILSFTADTNRRSQAVMARVGLRRDDARDFDHPALAEGHPLRRHWVYSMPKPRPGADPYS